MEAHPRHPFRRAAVRALLQCCSQRRILQGGQLAGGGRAEAQLAASKQLQRKEQSGRQATGLVVHVVCGCHVRCWLHFTEHTIPGLTFNADQVLRAAMAACQASEQARSLCHA